MAFPVVVTTNESATPTASTSHIVNLPASLVAGNLILILCDKGTPAVTATFNALAGWDELLDENIASGLAMWYRVSDGTEGATVTFTSSGAIRDACTSYQISGAENPATQAPQLSTVATAASANPNATTCTPTGGAKDYLWITMFGQVGEQADDDTLVSVTPTNYGATQLEKTCGVAGTNLGGMIASAHRTNNAASEDAGAWTSSDTGTWRAYTIAIHPAPAATNAPAGDAVGVGEALQPTVLAQGAPHRYSTVVAPSLAVTQSAIW
jgi:hypothetical protein